VQRPVSERILVAVAAVIDPQTRRELLVEVAVHDALLP